MLIQVRDVDLGLMLSIGYESPITNSYFVTMLVSRHHGFDFIAVRDQSAANYVWSSHVNNHTNIFHNVLISV